MAATYYSPFIPAFNSNGAPLAGARLAFFVSDTSTPTPIYADEALATQLPNPVPSDAAAKYPPIYLDESVTYRVIQTGPDGVQIGDTIDPYVPGQALKGDAGPTGPANSTYTTKAAIAAAPTSNLSAIYAPEDGSERTTYTWTLGNFTGRADAIASNGAPLTTGAWLPPDGAVASFGKSVNIALPLDRSIPRTLAFMAAVDPFTTASQQSKLESAFADAAGEGYSLTAHPDAAYRRDGVLDIGTSFDGLGATFVSLSDGFNALRCSGTGVNMRNFKTLGAATDRGNGDDRLDGLYGVDLYDFSLSNIEIGSVDDDGARGFAAAGALFRSCQRGRIDNLRVSHSRADGIHVTFNSKDLDFNSPYVYQSGDDGFAVVDYIADPGFVENIKTFGGTIREARARGMSVVGGRNIRYNAPSVYQSSAAAFLFTQESGQFNTKAVSDARVIDGFAKGCVTGVDLPAFFSNAVYQASGQATDCYMSGRIEGIGSRGNAGISYADPNVARLNFDLTMADVVGTDFMPIAVNMGGRDCEGTLIVQGVGGLALVMSAGGGAIGKHHVRFQASSGIRTQGGAINAISYFESAPNLQRMILEGSWDNAPSTLLIDVGDNSAKIERRDIWINGVKQP